jgi:hypothetical protein
MLLEENRNEWVVYKEKRLSSHRLEVQDQVQHLARAFMLHHPTGEVGGVTKHKKGERQAHFFF